MDGLDNSKHHIRLWHKDFWKLNLVNFFLAVSIYMQLPVFAIWMAESDVLSDIQVSVAVGIYGIGLFLFGTVCSYLVQRYRRNKVCVLSMLAMAVALFSVAYLRDNLADDENYVRWAFFMACLTRFLVGAFFGLTCMILNSTLIVDCCESSQRTMANVASAWSYRFAVALGPLLSVFLLHETGVSYTMYVSSMLCVLSVIVLLSVSFPFKAPEDTFCIFSLDRFFMRGGLSLILPLFLVSAYLGLLLLRHYGLVSYASLALGVMVAIIFQLFAGGQRRMSLNIKIGYALLLVSGVGFIAYAQYGYDTCLSMCLLGAGVSMVTTYFHRCFTDVADHCQRGTAQSTYILTFESGVALGAALSLLPCLNSEFVLSAAALSVLCVSIVVYLLHTSHWLSQREA